jgi:hypothetical protein
MLYGNASFSESAAASPDQKKNEVTIPQETHVATVLLGLFLLLRVNRRSRHKPPYSLHRKRLNTVNPFRD